MRRDLAKCSLACVRALTKVCTKKVIASKLKATSLLQSKIKVDAAAAYLLS